MKLLKFAIVGICLIGGLTAYGQEKNNKTPEEKAQKMTAKLVEKLEIEDSQKASLEAVNLEFVQSAGKIKNDPDISDEIKKSQIKSLKEDYFANLQEVLTEDQYAAFKELKKERKTKKSLEEKARAKTDRMTEELGLSADQDSKLYDLNLKVAKKIKAIKQNEEFSDEKKKEFIKGNKKDYKTVLATILTEDQMAQLEELKEKKKEERKAKKLEDK